MPKSVRLTQLGKYARGYRQVSFLGIAFDFLLTTFEGCFILGFWKVNTSTRLLEGKSEYINAILGNSTISFFIDFILESIGDGTLSGSSWSYLIKGIFGIYVSSRPILVDH